MFVSWLRSSEADRDRYADAKQRAAEKGDGRYNDLKAGVVYDVYEHAFYADPCYHHQPQPRRQSTDPPPMS